MIGDCFSSSSSAGGEVEGTSSVSDVSLPNEEQGVDVDPNKQLHLPKPILRWDRVHHLHQHQRQVGSSHTHLVNSTWRQMSDTKHDTLTIVRNVNMCYVTVRVSLQWTTERFSPTSVRIVHISMNSSYSWKYFHQSSDERGWDWTKMSRFIKKRNI